MWSNRRIRRFVYALAGLLVIWAGLHLLVPRPPLRDGISISRAVYDKDGGLMRLTLSNDEKYRLWLGLPEFSPYLVDATLLQEDRYFRYHPGVNPFSLVRSAWVTYVDGSRRMGGSTITMQLARIRYGMETTSVPGKLMQILKALQIELHYTKDEILEAYLNLAPYGLNVEGAPAASLIYFGKRPSGLSLHEAITLAVIPQDPSGRMRFSHDDRNGGELQQARLRLYGLWAGEFGPQPDTLTVLEAGPILRRPSELPFFAPHFVYQCLEREPHEPELFTTLDRGLQSALERVTKRYIESKRNVGITNACAMLLDFRDMEVRAMIGSADFFDDEIQGQVNGTNARRSPGSAVKPFVYALAIDEGHVHPMTMLKDAPAAFGAYSPDNYDHDFLGPVKVKDALVRSRNLPALQVAAMLDGDGLYGLLEDAGVSGLRERKFYGLGTALGGAEVTMQELATMYACLANYGTMRPLRMLTREPREEGKRLVGPESAYLVLQMLAENPEPGTGYERGWTAGGIPVSWKTGTSFSFRDAWSVGVFGPYVLAVWVGNFDGRGDPAFIGREAAGPLFFGMVDAVKAQDPSIRPVTDRRLLNLAEVDVCAVSGGIPGRYCDVTEKAWFIPGVSPIDRCEIHREVVVDARTGLRIPDNGSAYSRREVYEFWPSDLLKIFREAGIPRRTPPAWDPRYAMSYGSASGAPPEITSPQGGVVYMARVSRDGGASVPLKAVTDADASEVHWFADETYLGKSESGKTFFWEPEPGDYVVRAVDSQGRSDSRPVKVEATM